MLTFKVFLVLSQLLRSHMCHVSHFYPSILIDPLTAEEEALVNSKPAWNTRRAEDKPLGDMLPETKELLREFYWPFNVKLASVLDDEGFHWNADPVSELENF